MPKENDSPMAGGRSGLRVVHSTPGGWDASAYHYATELQQDKPKNNTGLQGGMGDVSMKYQPSHKQPPNRRKLAGKAPDYMNGQEPTPLAPVNPEIEKIIEEDLKKRNIAPKKPRTKKTK